MSNGAMQNESFIKADKKINRISTINFMEICMKKFANCIWNTALRKI